MDDQTESWLTEAEAEQIERHVTASGFAGLPMVCFTAYLTARLLWPKVWSSIIET
jgi:hypothetical protein